MDGAAIGRDRESAGLSLAVVVPFYNEEALLPATLESLAAQTRRPDQLVLVDNGSTDASSKVCREFLARSGIGGAIYAEPRPGKINALETGCRFIRTDIVAFCDADTHYPPQYFETAAAILARKPKLAGVMAPDLPAPPADIRTRLLHFKKRAVGVLLAKQCHTGGFGQIFRTAMLRAAGGYSAAQWPYVLEDHEIAHRMLKQGPLHASADLWCVPSTRRTDRTNVSWTLAERLLYHATPFARKDWFFYEFLARRFEARNLANTNLRNRAAFEGVGAEAPLTAAAAERS